MIQLNTTQMKSARPVTVDPPSVEQGLGVVYQLGQWYSPCVGQGSTNDRPRIHQWTWLGWSSLGVAIKNISRGGDLRVLITNRAETKLLKNVGQIIYVIENTATRDSFEKGTKRQSI